MHGMREFIASFTRLRSLFAPARSIPLYQYINNGSCNNIAPPILLIILPYLGSIFCYF